MRADLPVEVRRRLLDDLFESWLLVPLLTAEDADADEHSTMDGDTAAQPTASEMD